MSNSLLQDEYDETLTRGELHETAPGILSFLALTPLEVASSSSFSFVKNLFVMLVKVTFYFFIAVFAILGWVSLITLLTLLAYYPIYKGIYLSTILLKPASLGLLYITAEAIFLIVMFIFKQFDLYRFSHISHRVDFVPTLPPDERRSMLKEIIAYERIEDLLSGWFFGAAIEEIHHGNLVEWMSGIILHKFVNELSDEEERELHEYVDWVEESLGRKLHPGFNPDISCMRLLLDPVEIHHRPLIIYLIIIALNEVCKLIMIHVLGFKSHRPLKSSDSPVYWIRDRRPERQSGSWIDLLSNPPSPSSPVSKSPGHASKKHIPIVFFHGLGIGYATYITFLATMVYMYPRVSIVLFEKPSISMRLNKKHRMPQEFADEVKECLLHQGFTKAVFAGHSMGTACVAWICKFHPELIHKTFFIDPICFCLWKHHVAYNFLYSQPKGFFDFLIKISVASEHGVSLYLRRHFCWYYNTFFWKELPDHSIIYLAERDMIINAASVFKYICHWRDLKDDPASVKVVVLDGFTHAQVMASRELLQVIHQLVHLIKE